MDRAVALDGILELVSRKTRMPGHRGAPKGHQRGGRCPNCPGQCHQASSGPRQWNDEIGTARMVLRIEAGNESRKHLGDAGIAGWCRALGVRDDRRVYARGKLLVCAQPGIRKTLRRKVRMTGWVVNRRRSRRTAPANAMKFDTRMGEGRPMHIQPVGRGIWVANVSRRSHGR